FTVHGIALILVVGLLVSVRSSGAISGEREKATWDGLLTTPLEPRDLIRGKLWGIIDSIKPYLGAYLVGALIWAVPNGGFAVYSTVLCWSATWLILYFQAANGVYWSARSPNSWQS